MQMLHRMQMAASLTCPPVISRLRVHVDMWTRFSLRCKHVVVTAMFTSAELGIFLLQLHQMARQKWFHRMAGVSKGANISKRGVGSQELASQETLGPVKQVRECQALEPSSPLCISGLLQVLDPLGLAMDFFHDFEPSRFTTLFWHLQLQSWMFSLGLFLRQGGQPPWRGAVPEIRPGRSFYALRWQEVRSDWHMPFWKALGWCPWPYLFLCVTFSSRRLQTWAQDICGCKDK